MTTSSPAAQRVTPSPTFQTTPEASEPPMWWSSAWERKTETGWPSAAHTLLKLTPAAMTRTTTSKAPGSGVGISSSWNASSGSPKRSSRMTQAAIVGGRSPGSASNRATWLTSTATYLTAPGPTERWPDATRLTRESTSLQPVLPAAPEVDAEDHAGDQKAADPPAEEVPLAVDVTHQPAEVLAEEAGHERPRHEQCAGHAQPRGRPV